MSIFEFFLLFTAILFTGVGYMFGRQSKDHTTELVINAAINTLIDGGYLCTEEIDGETHLVKIKDIK